MAIPVRIPEEREDRPRIAVLGGIAAVGIAIGIAGAWWGTYERRDAGEAATVAAPAPAPVAAPVAAPAPASAPTPAPAPEPAPEPEPARAPEPAAAPEPEPAVVAAPEPASVAGAAPADSLRVVRGRVAYLRCEGVPQRPGPVPCPRDEALEAAAWAAIDPLVGCAALPRREGEADVVLDLATGAIPEIRARDTFARDVVRLDGERVVACLTPALTRVQQTMGASRLLVSFRFAIRGSE